MEPGEDEADHPERLLYSISRSHMSDVLLTLYFTGACIASGIAGLLSPPTTYGTLLADVAGGTVAMVFSWGMIVLGVCGIVARLADSRQGEFYVIIALSIFTFINALLLLTEFSQTALRLLFAPAMMLPYAWMRLGFNVSRGQVRGIQRAIIRRDRKERGEH